MGEIVGLDLSAVLQMADALGYDRAAMVYLLPFVEAGLLEGIRKHRDQTE